LEHADEAVGEGDAALLVAPLVPVAEGEGVTPAVVIFGRVLEFVAELSSTNGCGLLTFPTQVKLPLIETCVKSGHVKFSEVDCTLKLPLTTARLGKFNDAKSPVISTFPVTALSELNPSTAETAGFPVSTKFEPMVVRLGKFKVFKD